MTTTPDALAESDDVYILTRASGESVVTFSKLPHVSPKAPQRWVHMAREGLWKGHHSGHVIEFTSEIFAAFVDRFNATKNATAAKYGHPDGDDFPAAGWVLDVEIRPTGLWGLVEFTPRAAQSIADGEFRYCSVEFALASIDRETGEPAGPVLSGLGLTNVPFIDGLEPITLSRVGAPAREQHRSLSMAMEPEKVLAQIAKDLGLKADATVDAIRKKFDAVANYLAAISDNPADKSPPTLDETAKDAVKASAFGARAKLALSSMPDVKKCADDLLDSPGDAATEAATTMVCDKLMTLTGLDAPGLVAAIDANGDALKALLTGAPAAGLPSDSGAQLSQATTEISVIRKSNADLATRLSAVEATNAKLKADLAQREQAAKSAAIESMFNDALADGYGAESMRQEITDYALSAGVEKAKTLLLSTGRVPTGAITREGVKASGGVTPPKAPDADPAALDVEPRNDEEKSLLRMLSQSPKKTKAAALKAFRGKSAAG